MSFRWPIPAETIDNQRKASDPAYSVWVRANAGSGKTHVLAQRVVRLLLNGADPSKILCLTFTKAAAANMSLRVFGILSKWTALDDDALRKTLDDLGAPETIGLDAARQLFARAVETPGGLKIQTIHAFCERILHLFPFEANVPARFEALDEDQQSLLLQQAREEMFEEAYGNSTTKLAAALGLIAEEISSSSFEGLLREATSHRAAMHYAARLQSDRFARELGTRLGLAPGETRAGIEESILQHGLSKDRWQVIVDALKASSSNDVKVADRYLECIKLEAGPECIEAYFDIFFTTTGNPRKSLVTKKIAKDIADDLDREFARISPLREKLKAARVTEQSTALYLVCDKVLQNYTRLKQAGGYLDFEDLIERTNGLLKRSDTGWILYKLDQGIDHILVDEAQDTSPQQWQILTSLADEFFAGESARTVKRTFFAVGDEKQSIFSFQGAVPKEFGENATKFSKQVKDAGREFDDVPLRSSFRSSATILTGVDTVFGIKENYTGLSSEDLHTVHEAVKKSLPGLVEIWPLIGPQPKAEPDDWLMPVDAMRETAPQSILARRVADKINDLLHADNGGYSEAVHDEQGKTRRVQAGDIMILVRRRDAFFEAVIRALKMKGIAVAGADRLKLMDHIAVMDLVAAGRAALLPQDDFTLACVLKSPLFGLDDDDLMKLAPGRKHSLLRELQNSPDPRHVQAYERIVSWGSSARSLGPFRFFADLLGAQRGRKAILGRLGAEAGDAVDEFLRLALEWERTQTPSLTAFLQHMQGADIEIKRDLEAAGGAVRVMTVHASKGLESKIVFLPDTCATPTGRFDPNIMEIVDGHEETRLPVWKRKKGQNPQAVEELVNKFREDQAAEYRRLLYVAMTRAEERLYICGHHGEREPPKDCWYEMIRNTLPENLALHPAPWGEGEVIQIGSGARLEHSPGDLQPDQENALPSWLFEAAPHEAPPAPPIRPSQALDAADQMELTGERSAQSGRAEAILAGTLTHALLQYLPGLTAEKWELAAHRYVARRGAQFPSSRREAIVKDVISVLERPDLAPLFTADARAEVAISGRIAKPAGGEIEITGRIDRMGISTDAIYLADFKTGSIPPGEQVPQKYIAQMALYRAALEPLFPGRAFRVWIVWTGGPTVHELGPDALTAALSTILR
jgi:ATP-dependent helicase/nuclease subunit A